LGYPSRSIVVVIDFEAVLSDMIGCQSGLAIVLASARIAVDASLDRLCSAEFDINDMSSTPKTACF